MQKRLSAIIFLLSLFFILFFATHPKITSAACDPPGSACGSCVTQRCSDGNACASGHTYCVWDANGNYCGDCQEEVNNCASQCSTSSCLAGSVCLDLGYQNNQCCSDIGHSGVVCNEHRLVYCDSQNQCDSAKIRTVEANHPCNWMSSCCPAGTSCNSSTGDCETSKTCNYNRSYNECDSCPLGYSRKVDEYTWSDGSGVCKSVAGNCDQHDRACDSCNYSRSYNQCCSLGYSQKVDEYTWASDGSACYYGEGTCNQPDSACSSCDTSQCSGWTNGACGAGGCSSTQRQQTRTCPDGSSCSSSQCVNDSTCSSGGGAYCGDGSCNNGETCSTCPGDCGSCPPPPLPTGLSANCPIPGTNATLSWNASSGATSYNLYIDGTLFAPNFNGTGYSVGSVPGSTHSWGVSACNSAGCSSIQNGLNYTCLFQDAKFYSQITPPSSMMPGDTTQVSVAMSNTGNVPWTVAGGYKLGWTGVNEYGTPYWGVDRIPVSFDVVPGYIGYGFNFPVTAPATPGKYNFGWRMLQEGIAWFGDYSTNFVVNVDYPACPAGIGGCGDSVPNSWTIASCGGSWVRNPGPNYGYDKWCGYYINSTRNNCYKCNSTTSAWIQSGGDVHANSSRGINASGGP